MKHSMETLRAFATSIRELESARDARRDDDDAYKEKKRRWDAWDEEREYKATREGALWALVRRTRAHEAFAETYGTLPSSDDGWRRTKYRPVRWCVERDVKPNLLGVDCEMCETENDDRALVGVSVVRASGETALKTLVKPPGKIIDLRREITGLTEESVAAATMTLKDVQDAILALCKPGTVLVGHSLAHDLRALKIDHQPVIDSAMLFRYANLPRSTPSLAMLCETLLDRKMRQGSGGVHDSVEDAKAALDLALWEARQPTPTYEIEAPTIRADSKDMCKLFVHRIPRGMSREVIESLFDPVDRALVTSIEGKFLDDADAAASSQRSGAKPTSCHVIFPSVQAANDAFKRLDGVSGTDAIGRPQKACKAVNKAGRVAAVCVRKMASHGGRVYGAKDSGDDGKRTPSASPASALRKKRQRKPRIALPGDAK